MSAIQVNAAGLSSTEAGQRLAAQGPNEVAGEPPITVWRVFASQFTSFVVWLLIGAAVVSAVIGEVADAVAILVIVALNAIIGSVQELRAERAIEALRSLTTPMARVRRDGRPQLVPTRALVVGDILLLEAGEVVGADATLIEANTLRVNEAILTGESEPVLRKAGEPVLMATSVMAGTGAATVVKVGDNTTLGSIAQLATRARIDETPLRQRVTYLTKILVFASLGIVAVIAVASLLRGVALSAIFLTSVSLAVAAVPEGLPAVVTLALALGVRRMARRNVLVRKLEAVETLGCATVICSDKTGTLTTGTMAVRELWGPDRGRLLDAAAACCDAELGPDATSGLGDPTEVAILVEAARHGIRRTDIEAQRPRQTTRPFDEERRRMAIFRADGRIYVKGAVESVLPLCSAGTDGVTAEAQRFAARGLRVLAVATGDSDVESGLTCHGLVGIADPPRPEAIAAVREARDAGITTVMITGDHALTANAIADELGITDGNATDRVHARVTPANKLAIVRSWKTRGAIVAMTGDGVNDAPALREAHIGIAMGKGGTSVAREAADIVLADDNFASIVHGVREGRAIFESIRRSVVYLLSGNASELALMLVCALVGLPLPLLPLHLLWINLVTDGLPALALVMQPSDDDVMAHGPRRPSEPLVGRSQWITVGYSALLQTMATVAIFGWTLTHADLATARTLTFATVVLCELVRLVVPQRASAGKGRSRRSWSVIAVALGSLAMQVLMQTLPAARRLLELQRPTLVQALTCVVIAIAFGGALLLASRLRHRRTLQ